MKRVFTIIIILSMLISSLIGCENNNKDAINDVKSNQSTKKYNTDEIVALSEIWTRARQISPFWDENRLRKWDSMYEEALAKLITMEEMELNQYEVYEVFEEFVSFLDDGHVVLEPSEKQKYYIGFLPYKFVYCNNKYYIESRTEEEKIPLGSEILEINDEPVATYISNQKNKISVKTKGAHEYFAIKRAEMGKFNSSVKLSYINSETGQKETAEPSYSIRYDAANNYKWEKLLNTFSYINGEMYSSPNFTLKLSYDLAYLEIHSFEGENMVEEFYNNILPIINKPNLFITEDNKLKFLLIDVRNNEGGNSLNGHAILELLTGKIADTGVYYCQYVGVYEASIASYNKYKNIQVIDNVNNEIILKMLNNSYTYVSESKAPNLNIKNNETFKGKIGILTSYKTGSAADDFAMYAKQIEQCTLYGTNTKGATGQIAIFELKNKMTFRLSALDRRTEKGEKIQNVGIEPDFHIELDMDKLIKKTDTQIEFAIFHMRDKLVQPKY